MCETLSYYLQIFNAPQIKAIACLHKAFAENINTAQPADIFQVYGEGIAPGAKVVHLESVAAIECVCIAADTGEVLLLHTSPYKVGAYIQATLTMPPMYFV